MRKVLLVLVLLSATSAFAQDVIVKKDGSTILSKVIEVGTSEIRYKKYSNQEGPTYVIRKDELLSINYDNGEKEEFGSVEPKQNEVTEFQSSRFNALDYLNSNSYERLNESSSRLPRDPSDYSFIGLSYTADFDYIGEGVAGLSSHIFSQNGFGLSSAIGWGVGASVAQVKLGPNYCYPLSETAFVYVPLQAVMNYYVSGSDSEITWGAQLTPSIGFKFNKFVFAAGVALGWAEGSDRIGTGFNVSLALTL